MDSKTMSQWFEKAKMGFIMGAAVGATTGFLYGSYFVLSVGPPPGKSYLRTIGGHMLQQGGMLGFFLSIGSLIRTEEEPRRALAFPSTRTPVAIVPRSQLHTMDAEALRASISLRLQ
ncbi:subunit of TIM23 translocase complex [Polyrhizophydium stewartii]|uniref:Subunit of TIM23 translocase complex n=1 Tax=Polyrhizophydium stewartii TaxID=2732419 RepID=A0ABR4N6W0_9FUNG